MFSESSGALAIARRVFFFGGWLSPNMDDEHVICLLSLSLVVCLNFVAFRVSILFNDPHKFHENDIISVGMTRLFGVVMGLVGV